MRFAAVVFAFLTVTASADFFIGDTAFAPDRPRASAGRVLVVSDGTMFYVVSGSGMNRVNQNGAILDAEPFGVPDMLGPISVAYGRGILVITHRRSAFLLTSTHATAMTTAGEILWSTYLANHSATVVYDGRHFVIVHRDTQEQTLVASTLDDSGSIIRSATIAADVQSSAPRAMLTAGGLLAVWRELGVVRAVRFDSNGPLGDIITVGTGSHSGFFSELDDSFAVAASGTDALVAWTNHSSNLQRAWVSAQRLDANASPIGELIEIPVANRATDPDAVWDGERYQVAWSSWSVDFQQINLEVASIGSQEVSVIHGNSAMLSPALAITNDSVLMLAWNDYTRGGIRGKLVTPGMTWNAAPERILRTVRLHPLAPSAVWTGDQFVIAWLRDFSELLFRRFDRNGAALDAEGRVLATTDNAQVVRIASTGSETAMVWVDRGRVMLARIDADGTPIDAAPLVVASNAGANSADVATNGNRFVVTWAGASTVNARRLSARGGFVDQSPIVLADAIATDTRVVFDGATFRIGFLSRQGIEAASLSPSGATSGSVLLAESFGSSSLAVATNGSSHLFISGLTYVLTSRDFQTIRSIDGPYLEHATVVWTGTTFLAAGNGRTVTISPAGAVGWSPIPSFFSPAENTLAASGDGTALLVYTAQTRSFSGALYGRFIAPRRRAAGH